MGHLSDSSPARGIGVLTSNVGGPGCDFGGGRGAIVGCHCWVAWWGAIAGWHGGVSLLGSMVGYHCWVPW